VSFDAFISYSSKQKKAADVTLAALEAEGIRCWIAHREIPVGNDWGPLIFEAIEQCSVMILMFSNNANHSKQIAREIGQASEKKIPILPLRIEQVEATGRLGYLLQGIHWIDTTNPPEQETLRRLASDVKSLLQNRQAQPRQASAERQSAAQQIPIQTPSTLTVGVEYKYISLIDYLEEIIRDVFTKKILYTTIVSGFISFGISCMIWQSVSSDIDAVHLWAAVFSISFFILLIIIVINAIKRVKND
jgi:hypothetical protein